MNKLLFVLVSFGLSTTLLAQSGDATLSLNTIVDPTELGISAKSDAETQYFELNEAIFEEGNIQVGNLIRVETLRGPRTLRIGRVSEFIPGILSIRAGSVADSKVFSLTYSNGRMTGLYHEDTQKAQLFSYNAKAKVHSLTTRIPEQLECYGDVQLDDGLPMVDPKDWNEYRTKSKTAAGQVALNTDLDVNTTLDVMAVYTNPAAVWSEQNGLGDILVEIAQSFNLSQTALENSGVPVTLRVVHVHNTTYQKPFGTASGEVLRLITASPTYNPFGGFEDGEMDEVHGLRDQYGADVVSLFDDVNDTGGIAWLITNRFGVPNLGFNLNRVQQVNTGYTLVHEIGHNLGTAHSRTQAVQTAGISGGVFQESVGYQNFVDSVVTIMAYGREGFSEVPVFSSPDIEWEGNLAGDDNAVAPANAALSWAKIKNVAASYRPARFAPPVSEVTTSDITVSMDQGNTQNVVVQITNSGQSDLDYSVDFAPSFDEQNAQLKAAAFDNTDPEIIFESSFEAAEGFFPRRTRAVSGWRIFSSNNDQFQIGFDSAKTGVNHLRIFSTDEGGSQSIFSPVFPAKTRGSYRVEFEMLLRGEESLGEELSIFLRDHKLDELHSGLGMNNGILSVIERGETGNTVFTDVINDLTANTYYNVVIEYNSMSEEITYLVDGTEVLTTEYGPGSNVPAEFIISNTNSVPGAALHIDDLSIKQYAQPYPWLQVDRSSGSVGVGRNQDLVLTFDTFNVTEGTYRANLMITTNEDSLDPYMIPIELNVSNIVSNEEDDEVAVFELDQNYPNPFNPSTNIRFNLQQASDVQLDVYNVMGQKVATLVDGRRQAGAHVVSFNAANMASGMYIYRLQAAGQTLSRRMLLLK